MGNRRRSRRSAAAAPPAAVDDAVTKDGTVVELVPFADGQPVRVADLNVDVDDTSVQERLDGPLTGAVGERWRLQPRHQRPR